LPNKKPGRKDACSTARQSFGEGRGWKNALPRSSPTKAQGPKASRRNSQA